MDLQRASKYIEQLIRSDIIQGRILGANFRVLHKGKVLYDACRGYQDMDQIKPLVPNSIFRLFSLTKPITAVGFLRLFEEGRVDLLDPVSMYLPGFKDQKVLCKDSSVWGYHTEPVCREVTLWDLLTMTSGIPYMFPDCEAGKYLEILFNEVEQKRKSGQFMNTVEIANRVGALPLQFQPGESWMYGFSADILGAVAEVVTRKPFDTYLKESVFEPLGMHDTGFYVPEEKRERFCDFTAFDRRNRLVKYDKNDFGMEGYDHKPAYISGGAGLVSTIEDYTKFAANLSGNDCIIGRRTRDMMSANHLSARQRKSCDWESMKGYGYGCLVRVLADPAQAATNANAGEFGWDGWSGTYVCIDPKEDLAILYFIQRAGAGFTPLIRKLRAIVYGCLE